MTDLTPTTLRALLIRMHDAIWGPYVEPIERQNEELEWLALLSRHIKAWETEQAEHAEAERKETVFLGMVAEVIGMERTSNIWERLMVTQEARDD